jgi:hypothetical protein
MFDLTWWFGCFLGLTIGLIIAPDEAEDWDARLGLVFFCGLCTVACLVLAAVLNQH